MNPIPVQKKPSIVEAFQHEGSAECAQAIALWVAENGGPAVQFLAEGDHVLVGLLAMEGVTWARPRDWVIRGVKGEFYPCPDDVFEMTYQRLIHHP